MIKYSLNSKVVYALLALIIILCFFTIHIYKEKYHLYKDLWIESEYRTNQLATVSSRGFLGVKNTWGCDQVFDEKETITCIINKSRYLRLIDDFRDYDYGFNTGFLGVSIKFEKSSGKLLEFANFKP